MQKVFSANKLYSLTAKIADYCFSNGLFFVIENPVRSLFWLTTPIQAMKRLPHLFFQCHVACAYGSKRPKKTMLATNHSAFMQLNLACPGVRSGQHVHARRGQQFINNRRIFATHEESEHPAGLCSAVAQIVLQICQECGLVLPPSSMEVAATEHFACCSKPKPCRTPLSGQSSPHLPLSMPQSLQPGMPPLRFLSDSTPMLPSRPTMITAWPSWFPNKPVFCTAQRGSRGTLQKLSLADMSGGCIGRRKTSCLRLQDYQRVSLFFLHEWRRCVCRFCTSHLSRVKIELQARLRGKQKQQTTTPTKPNKTKHARATCKVTRKALKARGRVRQGR